MIAINHNGRIVRLTKRPNPKHLINRYCHLDARNASPNKTNPCYLFVYPNDYDNKNDNNQQE